MSWCLSPVPKPLHDGRRHHGLLEGLDRAGALCGLKCLRPPKTTGPNWASRPMCQPSWVYTAASETPCGQREQRAALRRTPRWAGPQKRPGAWLWPCAARGRVARTPKCKAWCTSARPGRPRKGLRWTWQGWCRAASGADAATDVSPPGSQRCLCGGELGPAGTFTSQGFFHLAGGGSPGEGRSRPRVRAGAAVEAAARHSAWCVRGVAARRSTLNI